MPLKLPASPLDQYLKRINPSIDTEALNRMPAEPPAAEPTAPPIQRTPPPTQAQPTEKPVSLGKPKEQVTPDDLPALEDADNEAISIYQDRINQLSTMKSRPDFPKDEYGKLVKAREFRTRRSAITQDIRAGRRQISEIPALPEAEYNDDVQRLSNLRQIKKTPAQAAGYIPIEQIPEAREQPPEPEPQTQPEWKQPYIRPSAKEAGLGAVAELAAIPFRPLQAEYQRLYAGPTKSREEQSKIVMQSYFPEIFGKDKLVEDVTNRLAGKAGMSEVERWVSGIGLFLAEMVAIPPGIGVGEKAAAKIIPTLAEKAEHLATKFKISAGEAANWVRTGNMPDKVWNTAIDYIQAGETKVRGGLKGIGEAVTPVSGLGKEAGQITNPASLITRIKEMGGIQTSSIQYAKEIQKNYPGTISNNGVFLPRAVRTLREEGFIPKSLDENQAMEEITQLLHGKKAAVKGIVDIERLTTVEENAFNLFRDKYGNDPTLPELKDIMKQPPKTVPLSKLNKAENLAIEAFESKLGRKATLEEKLSELERVRTTPIPKELEPLVEKVKITTSDGDVSYVSLDDPKYKFTKSEIKSMREGRPLTQYKREIGVPPKLTHTFEISTKAQATGKVAPATLKTAPIPKELEGLAVEARKFGSADEFIRGFPDATEKMGYNPKMNKYLKFEMSYNNNKDVGLAQYISRNWDEFRPWSHKRDAEGLSGRIKQELTDIYAQATGKVTPATLKTAPKEPWQMTKEEFQRTVNQRNPLSTDVNKRDILKTSNEMDRLARQHTEKIKNLIPKNSDVSNLSDKMGIDLYQSNHKYWVAEALSEGKPVSTEVLKDYPDLVKIRTEPPRPALPPTELPPEVSKPATGKVTPATLKTAPVTFPKDMNDRIIAGQDLSKTAREQGYKIGVNPDGSVDIWHGTTTENAQKILKQGELTPQSFLSPNKEGSKYYSKVKGKQGESIKIKVDARDIEYSTGTGEIYVPNGLKRDIDGIWKSPQIRTETAPGQLPPPGLPEEVVKPATGEVLRAETGVKPGVKPVTAGGAGRPPVPELYPKPPEYPKAALIQELNQPAKTLRKKIVAEYSEIPTLGEGGGKIPRGPKYADLTGQPNKLKDLGSGILFQKSQSRDMYRNFKAVYGEQYPTVKKKLLDPFDKSKGKYADFQEKYTTELNETIVKGLGIERGSAESSAVMDFGEGLVKEQQLIDRFGAKKTANIIAADKWFRRKYDDLLAEVNKARERIYPGQPKKQIPKRNDYYRHFRELEGGRGLANIFETPAGIESQLAGISEFTKPKSKFLSFAQRRLGFRSKRDAVGGFIDYIPAAAYDIHIDPHIGNFRTLSKELAEQTQNTRHLNNFVEYLTDFANDLAGKTNPNDRWLQKTIAGGRKTIAVARWFNTRVKMNTIIGNASASVGQIFNIPAGIAKTKQYSALGAIRTLGQIFTENKAMKLSSYIKERYVSSLYNKFDKGMINNTRKFATWLTGIGDEIGTKFNWNSFYEQALSKGIDDPIKYADDMTREVGAGRGIGEVPLLQKSVITQIVAPFQLEVGNAWHVLGDMVTEKEFGAIVTLFVTSYLMNQAAKEIRGSDVVFDPINALIEGSKMLQDEPDTKIGIAKMSARLAGEVLSNVPFGQTVAAMIPETGVGGVSKRELFGQGDPTRYGGGLLAVKGLKDPLYKILPPFGGQQIKKTVEGVKALREEAKETPEGRTTFKVEPTTSNIIRATLFGPYATKEGKEYSKERSELEMTLLRQDRERKENWTAAEELFEKLNKLDAEAKVNRIYEISQTDKELYRALKTVIEEHKLGLTYTDRMTKRLGVENGMRAEYIIKALSKFPSKKEKGAYLIELVNKDILTPKTWDKIKELKAK